MFLCLLLELLLFEFWLLLLIFFFFLMLLLVVKVVLCLISSVVDLIFINFLLRVILFFRFKFLILSLRFKGVLKLELFLSVIFVNCCVFGLFWKINWLFFMRVVCEVILNFIEFFDLIIRCLILDSLLFMVRVVLFIVRFEVIIKFVFFLM